MRAALVAILQCLVCTVVGKDHPAELVGRWRSENMPIGYWIVDRYSDGRIAKKAYFQLDYNGPVEIVVTWGRWKLSGKTYSEFSEGTSSERHRVFTNKWWKLHVQKITPQLFSHLSGDGHDTYEDRFADQRPLLEVQERPPKKYGWKKLVDTVTPARASIPSWVNGLGH